MARHVIALITLLIASACGLTSSMIVWKIVDEVNARLPEADRFSPYWWHLPKYRRLLRTYRRLSLSGERIAHLRTLAFVGVVATALAAVALGFGLGAAILGMLGCVAVWLVHRDSSGDVTARAV